MIIDWKSSLKQLDLPAEVAGRPVTCRGIHLQPFGYHRRLIERRDYWIPLLQSMGISWVVMLTEGDSCIETIDGVTPVDVLLDAGIIPLIREKVLYPRGFTNWQTVERCVPKYEQYGLHPFWLCRNEPGDSREHVGDVPNYPELWSTISRYWAEDAQIVTGSGGLAGFPDGPGYPTNPFEALKEHDGLRFFEDGTAFYAGHFYVKGRPLDYPYDDVSQDGIQLTETEYRAALDDFADNPSWYDVSLEAINAQRREWAHPGLTALEDDTCFLAWEKIAYWSLESMGFIVPMALTEGGTQPRDRAGSGNKIDIRWPLTTPNMVAKKTLAMFQMETPIFANCPWLLADGDLGGATAWETDAWVGWGYTEWYGREKPAVQTLQGNPPGPTPGENLWREVRAEFEALRALIAES